MRRPEKEALLLCPSLWSCRCVQINDRYRFHWKVADQTHFCIILEQQRHLKRNPVTEIWNLRKKILINSH